MDTQTIVKYFAMIVAPLYVVLFVFLPAYMDSAHLKPGEKRKMPLRVDVETFVQRFDREAANGKPVFLSPYYAYGWRTVGSSFLSAIGLGATVVFAQS